MLLLLFNHSVVTGSLVTPCTVACQARLSVGLPRKEYWSGLPFPPPGDLSNLGIKSTYPALQVDSLPADPPGKPQNTGVGSLFLLQWTFPIQELNWDLLHCWRILFQLSYQGSYHGKERKEEFRLILKILPFSRIIDYFVTML